MNKCFERERGEGERAGDDIGAGNHSAGEEDGDEGAGTAGADCEVNAY